MNDNDLLTEKAGNIIKAIREMKEQYPDWLKELPRIKGKELLIKYYDKILEIENIIENGENRTHLLYNMMSQNTFSFEDLSNIDLGKKIRNINESYDESVNIAKELNDDSKSYAWYSNMKLPTTYANSDNVKKHYKKLLEIFKNKPLIKVRRMHLFYESFLPENDNNIEQLKALFTILLVEFLMGIESKVVILKNINRNSDYKNHFYDFQSDIKSDKGYLLDFALYHNEKRDYDGVYDNNYISLFANFCYEKPSNTSICNDDSKRETEFDKVYYISDYIIFHILRNYYISLWYKDGYIEYLKKKTGVPYNIINIYEEKLKVMCFADFWNEYFHYINQMEQYFDKKKFIDLFEIDKEKPQFKKYKDMYEEELKKNPNAKQVEINKINDSINSKICEDFLEIINGFINITSEDLNYRLRDYFIRDKKDTLYNQLNELYDLYYKHEKDSEKEKEKVDFYEVLVNFIQKKDTTCIQLKELYEIYVNNINSLKNHINNIK